jgi:hypothetical protein
MFGGVQHVALDRPAGLVDLDGLAERRRCQPEQRCSEQNGARRLAGAQPVERPVLGGGEHEQLGGIPGRLGSARLDEMPMGNRRRGESSSASSGTLAPDTPSRAAS